MEPTGTHAYDLPARVASYDADMDIMHPNRVKMVHVALEVLAFPRDAAIRALDLGTGTGFFACRLLEEFPSARVVCVDVAEAMLDLARVRLAALRDRAGLRLGDIRDLSGLLAGEAPFDAVLSSYTLHHLDRREKVQAIRSALALLKPGGWLLNADLLVSEHRHIEQRIQELRVDGIVRRAGGDPRFADAAATRAFLDDVERRDCDRPLTLPQELAAMREAGLSDASVFWLEYREAVWGGRKPVD